jgi:transcriptional regulator with GAF, ATPase, and Fis domain
MQPRATILVRGNKIHIRQFEVSVVDGADRGARAVSRSDELSIGTADGNDLQLTDPSVSRHHCALRVDERGLELTDLGSRNGTLLGGVEVVRGYIQSGVRFRIGQTTIAVEMLDRDIEQPVAGADRFGRLLGGSSPMRRLYPLIEQCGQSAVTVLVQGETGTGKELIAEAIHAVSDRRDRPFVTVDCGILSHELAESELFGHVQGAFTGAERTRIGAFESADGGTVFLDEIGELPLSLQPLLLRVLENRTIRRVGSNQHRAIDVRVVAASHRDLRELVNAKRFRADLYYRLNVVKIVMPPLRERAGDVALLAAHYWSELRADPIPAAFLEQLTGRSWPGNVRELRNTVETAAQLGWQAGLTPGAGTRESYGQAKTRALAEWERTWVEELLAAHAGNLSAAARAARMGRSNLREIARRHGVALPSGASGAGETDEGESLDDD